MSLFEKMFGTFSSKELKKIKPIADRVLALDGEDSPYLTENCLLKDTDTPVAEQVQKLFVLDKNNMASPETAESE